MSYGLCYLDVCFSFQFEEEFLSRQQGQAQLVKCDEKISELQAELQAFRSQVNDRVVFSVLFRELCSFCEIGWEYSTNPI